MENFICVSPSILGLQFRLLRENDIYVLKETESVILELSGDTRTVPSPLKLSTSLETQDI